jgi:hypothetical protein
LSIRRITYGFWRGWAWDSLKGQQPQDLIILERPLKSAEFDRERYLALNPDVAATGADPWAHYLQFGRREGRALN